MNHREVVALCDITEGSFYYVENWKVFRKKRQQTADWGTSATGDPLACTLTSLRLAIAPRNSVKWIFSFKGDAEKWSNKSSLSLSKSGVPRSPLSDALSLSAFLAYSCSGFGQYPFSSDGLQWRNLGFDCFPEAHSRESATFFFLSRVFAAHHLLRLHRASY